MYRHPEALENLIESLRRFPGIGRRGAERIALALLEWPADDLRIFGELVAHLREEITRCPECGAFTGRGEACPVCDDPHRDATTLCVVETPAQIANIERSGSFRGRYHVLGGRLSPLDNKTADDLAIPGLLNRAGDGNIREVILALSGDVEGRATAVYLTELLHQNGFSGRISQPASGLPAGANLAYADAATLAAALAGRVQV